MAQPQPADWSAAYARIQRLADRDVLKLLQDSYKDVVRMLNAFAEREGIGAAVRRQQLEIIRRNLLREQSAIFDKMGRIVEARRAEAAAKAIRLSDAIDVALMEAAGRTGQARALREAVEGVLRQTVQVALARAEVSAVSLSERIYRTRVWMDGRLDRMINSALARGLTAREFAKEARPWFNPRVPGGTRYAALRLARSEINNAYHAISIEHSAGKPWVVGMKWHLSGSHPKPDVCDKYAKGGPKGDGVYVPPSNTPRKPHPHCFCFVTPVSDDEDDFLDNLVAGRYDDYLAQKIGASGRRATR